MIINYTDKQIWRKEAVKNPEFLYSHKNLKRIRSTLRRLERDKVSYDFKALDTEFIDWFTPFYKEQIGKKQNAKLFDIFSTTLGNPQVGQTYMSLLVYMNNEPVGGSIVTINEEFLGLIYRAFLPKWPASSLQASPSLYADYVTSLLAFEHGKSQISHGKDRNLFGIHSSIGQVIYKLSVGYSPRTPRLKTSESHNILNLHSNNIQTDTLVLEYPPTGDIIEKAYLFTTPENETKYKQITQYPELLKVEVIHI